MIIHSNLSCIADFFEPLRRIFFADISSVSVAGDTGHLVLDKSTGIETFNFQEPRHYYEFVGQEVISSLLFILKGLGTKTVCLTNAADGANPKLKLEDPMRIDDYINIMGVTSLTEKHNPLKSLRPSFIRRLGIFGILKQLIN